MTKSQEVIDVLNTDTRANELMALFKRAVTNHGGELTDKQISDAREFILMLAIQQNNRAMSILSEYAHDELLRQANQLTVGDKFKIDTMRCEDDELLEWYDAQEDLTLVADHVNEDGIWVKGCDFRIEHYEVIKL